MIWYDRNIRFGTVQYRNGNKIAGTKGPCCESGAPGLHYTHQSQQRCGTALQHRIRSSTTTNVHSELRFYNTPADVSIQGSRGSQDRAKGTSGINVTSSYSSCTYYRVIHWLPLNAIVVQWCDSKVFWASLWFPLKGNGNCWKWPDIENNFIGFQWNFYVNHCLTTSDDLSGV